VTPRRLADLGPTWRRQAPSSQSPDSSQCDPHPPGVKITAGSWKSRGVSYAYGTTAQVHPDAIVVATPADALKTVDGYMAPSVIRRITPALRPELRPSTEPSRHGTTPGVPPRHRAADERPGCPLTRHL